MVIGSNPICYTNNNYMKKGFLLTEMCSEGDCSILWDYDTIPDELKMVYDPLLGSKDSEVTMNIY